MMNPQFKEISMELTHRCFCNCVFCSSSSGTEPKIKEELNYDRILEIIKECIDKYHIETISLSGGEPILYPHFRNLVNFILENGLKLLIYTTGLMKSEDKLISWNKDYINYLIHLNEKYPNKIELIFDIHSGNKFTYEKTTQIPDSYSCLVKTLKKIITLDIQKSAHFVPFQFNWLEIEHTLKFVMKFNFDHLKILRFVPQGRASNYSNLELNLDEFYVLQKKLMELKIKYKEKIVLGHPIDFLANFNNRLFKFAPCRGGFDAPIILPNGKVYPCPAWKNIQDLSAGNIYSSNFEEIWNSPYFNAFRKFITSDYKKIIGKCEDCEFLNQCKGKCVAQRILYHQPELIIPNFLLLGHDPMCIKKKIGN